MESRSISPKSNSSNGHSCNGQGFGDPLATKKLGFGGLLVLIFYSVSGGPFGSEAAVRFGGPLFTLLGFTIVPIVWSMPQALMVAELSTTFPCDGGFVTWVTEAFGPFWGFQVGFLSVVGGLADLAVYPAMFFAYVQNEMCPNGDACLETMSLWPLPPLRIWMTCAFASIFTYLNYRGLEIVEKTTIVLTIFMLSPFVVLCALGIPHLRPSAWLDMNPTADNGAGLDWVTYANVLIWNLNSWDSAAPLAGEVSQPEKHFPRAMLCAGVMVVVTYILPIGVCIAALPPGQTWTTGFFVQAGHILGGSSLAIWILSAAIVGSMGQYISNQASNTFLLLGMAEMGHLPRVFARRSRHGTPTVGLIVTFIFVVLLSPFKVVQLVDLLNGIGVLADLLIYAAFIQLRRRCPDLHRPYRVPLGLKGCIVMLVGPFAILVMLLVLPVLQRDWSVVMFTLATVIGGPLIYFLLAVCRKQCERSFLPKGYSQQWQSGDEACNENCGLEAMPATTCHEPIQSFEVNDSTIGGLPSEVLVGLLSCGGK